MATGIVDVHVLPHVILQEPSIVRKESHFNCRTLVFCHAGAKTFDQHMAVSTKYEHSFHQVCHTLLALRQSPGAFEMK